jgi:hypothetical protein
MPDPDEVPGGQGDCARFGRADLRLMRRAARQGWGVPDDLKNEGVFQAARFLASGHPELVFAALKFLLAADKADLAAGRLALDREKLDLMRGEPDASIVVEVRRIPRAIDGPGRSERAPPGAADDPE